MLLNDKKVYVGPHISRKVGNSVNSRLTLIVLQERQSKIDEMRAHFTNPRRPRGH